MICCYCRKDDQNGTDNSHGICEPCYEQAEQQAIADLEQVELWDQNGPSFEPSSH